MRLWTAWNEPNNPRLPPAAVRQDAAEVGDPERDLLREDLQRDLQGIHETLFKNERVACGVTAPRGNNNPHERAPVGLAGRVPDGREEGGA